MSRVGQNCFHALFVAVHFKIKSTSSITLSHKYDVGLHTLREYDVMHCSPELFAYSCAHPACFTP